MTNKTGGPAFSQDYEHTKVLMEMQQLGDISAEQLIKLSRQLSGMTLRDYFAANAMPSILAPNPTTGQYPLIGDFEACAKAAYAMADAMLKAREQ